MAPARTFLAPAALLVACLLPGCAGPTGDSDLLAMLDTARVTTPSTTEGDAGSGAILLYRSDREDGEEEGAPLVEAEGLAPYRLAARPVHPPAQGACSGLVPVEILEDGSRTHTVHEPLLPGGDPAAPGGPVEYVFTTRLETRKLRLETGPGHPSCFEQFALWRLPDPGRVVPAGRPQVGDFMVGNELRRAIAVPLPSALEYTVAVPPGGFLDLALGVADHGTGMAPLDVVFEISAWAGRGKPEVLVHEVASAWDPWLERRVDLARFGGREATLRLDARLSGDPSDPRGEGRVPPGALWAHPAVRSVGKDPRRPSVLWVSIDTLRADHLGFQGYPGDTSPNLDRLAGRGVVFLQAQSAAPWTLSSHASMFTGTVPSYHGTDDRVGLPDRLSTAAEIFSRAGWFTGAFVTHHYLSETYDMHRGFQTHYLEQDARAAYVVDHALSWLRRHGDRPTFLFLHMFDPHHPYDPLPAYEEMFDPGYEGRDIARCIECLAEFFEPDLDPDPRELEHLIALYDAEIRYTDEQVGRLLEGLDRLGLADRTLVIITSDHGEEHRDHGRIGHEFSLFQEVLHVPLIFWGPALGLEGVAVDGPVRTIDILPTLLELVDLPLPELPEGGGVSLLPLMKGGSRDALLPAFAETDRRFLTLRSVRIGDEKLILDRLEGEARLYDLATDPHEKEDVGPARPERREGIRRDLEIFFDTQEGMGRLHAGTGREVEPSEEELEVLRSLGYVD